MNNSQNLKNCQVCKKAQTVGNNKPHSQHRTKRIILPNIQKTNGLIICTRCLRTKIKRDKI